MAKTYYDLMIDGLQAQDDFHRARSKAHTTMPEGDSLTKQAHAMDADINNIIKRYTPEAAHAALAARPGQYLDLQDAGDFHHALLLIQQANEDFASLPANIRTRFNNDPAQLVDALYDPNRVAELTALGVYAPTPAPDAPPAPAAPGATPPATSPATPPNNPPA